MHHMSEADNRKGSKMTYAELTAKLIAIEKETGLYLSDTCVDAENATDPNCEKSLFVAAAMAAGERAAEAGYDINDLIGTQIY
jgi:hypothetical protein